MYIEILHHGLFGAFVKSAFELSNLETHLVVFLVGAYPAYLLLKKAHSM